MTPQLKNRVSPLLSREQMERYSRQILLEEIGLAGQRRLLESRAVVVGAGGLGSPSSLYLAAAGVGTIGIVDGDRVELNNLHRQIVHTTRAVGIPKNQSAGQPPPFLPGQGCYRCLFPTPPPPGVVPSCAEGGVLGALAGFMGTLQATEAVKVLLGRGRTLVNRLFIFDALENDYRIVRWARNPNCPVCGDAPTIRELIDYDAFCGLPGRHAVAATDGGVVPEIGPKEAYRLGQEGAELIDVREPWEWAQARIPGAVLIPKGDVPQRLTEIDPHPPVLVPCAVGARSAD